MVLTGKRYLETVYGVKGHEALSLWVDEAGSMTVWTGLKVEDRPAGQCPLAPETARKLALLLLDMADIAERAEEPRG